MNATAATTTAVRPLYTIAKEIRKDWKNIPEYASVHLEAFDNATDITEMFYFDSVKGEVLYFLGSAGTWRGETAKRIKAELNQMCKAK